MISFIDIYRTTSSKLLKITLLFLFVFLLSGCNQDLPPIEADDFGYPKVTVYAKGKNVTGEEENQLSEWIPTGYKYNGDQIVIMAYNPASTSGGSPLKYTWNPWLCEGDDNICVSMYDSPRCELSTSEWCSNPRDLYENIANAPCYLAQGEGLYLLVTDPTNSDPTNPNTYENVNRLPSDAGYYTKSLWDKSTDSSMYNNGEQAQGYTGELIPNPTITYTDSGEENSTPSTRSAESYINGEAYFKILDRYYDDNSGYQYAVMKRGFDSIVPPPIASIIDFITDTMDNTSQELYERIVTDSEYQTSLKTLLILYMIVHGILFIGGASNMTQSELMSLFIKLIIVIQLLTGVESGQLFYNYFFQFFTSGLDEIISITTSNIDDTNNGFTFFDKLLGLLFSYETSMKIQALIWSFPSGFVVTFILYAAFALFTIAIAKAAMIYLLAYMAISLLIVVAPVFICFLLFQTTRPLFERWLSQFSNYFMQTVLVFAALNLLGQIIVDQIYMILGFKACFEDNLRISTWVFSKAWFICSDLSTGLVPMEVPGYGYNTTIPCDPPTNYECPDTSVYCEPFDPNCIDDRYPDLPFLDPDIEKEANLIDAFNSSSYTGLSTPMLYESSILLLMCYLMMKFNDVVPGLGKGIAGGGGNVGATALGSAAGSSIVDFKRALSGIKNAVGKMATGKTEQERAAMVRRGLIRVKSVVTDSTAAKAISASKVGKAGRFMYHGAGFVKDMLIPPGSMMIGTPEQIKAHKRKTEAAKRANREQHDLDKACAKLGLDEKSFKKLPKEQQAAALQEVASSLSYKEQLKNSMEEITGISKIKKGAAEFDAKYMKNGEFNFRAAGGAMRRGAGRALYKTETGKAIYDGAVSLKNSVKDGAASLKDSIKEEYRLNFTEQGRIDQENIRIKNNQIRALAEQYLKDTPARQKAEHRDLIKSLNLDENCKNLRIDKEEFLRMSLENQLKYIQRSHAELPQDLKDSEAVKKSLKMLNADILRAQIEKRPIIRTKRDTDPSILISEAYDNLNINRGSFGVLSAKDQLAALEKGLRACDLTGPGAADAYRAYRYLKRRTETQLEKEKAALKEQKRQRSFVYRAGKTIESIAAAPGNITNSVIKTVKDSPENLANYMGETIGKPLERSTNRVKNTLKLILGQRVRLEGREITAEEMSKQNYSKSARKVDSKNVDQLLKDACNTLNINAADLQSISREKGLEYISKKLAERSAKITKGRLFREYSDEYKEVSKLSEAHATLKAILDAPSRLKDTNAIQQRRADIDKQPLQQFKDADEVLQNSCTKLEITKATLDTIDPSRRMAYLEKAFSSATDTNLEEYFDKYKAFRSAQAVIEHHDKQNAERLLAIEEANRKEIHQQQAIANQKRAEEQKILDQERAKEQRILDLKRAEEQRIANQKRAKQEGISRQQAADRKVIEQHREKNIDKYCADLNIEKKELLLMDKEGQRKYLSRAYAALSAERKEEIKNSYKELRADITKNGAIENEATRTERYLSELGLTKAQLRALKSEERVAAIEKAYQNADLGVNGGAKRAAYEELKKRTKKDADKFKQEEEAKKTLNYKAIDATIKVGEAIGSVATKIGSIAKSAKKSLDKAATKIDNTHTLFIGKKMKDKDGNYIRDRDGKIVKKRSVRLLGKETTAEEIAKDKYFGASRDVDSGNAEQLLKDACNTLNINTATFQSISKERGLEYIAEKLAEQSTQITKGKTFQEYSDEYKEVSKLSEAHATLKAILDEPARRAEAEAKQRRTDLEEQTLQHFREHKKVEQNRDQNIDQWSKDLNIDKKELLLMDKASQENYLSRAYAALPEEKKNADLENLYKELKADIANNGAIDNEQIRIDKALTELGLSSDELRKLNNKKRLEAIENSYKNADLGVNGNEKQIAFRLLKEKAEGDIEKAREKANRTIAAKINDKTNEKMVEFTSSTSNFLSNTVDKVAHEMEPVGNAVNKAKNTLDLLSGKSVRMQGAETATREIYDRVSTHASQSVNADNAEQLLKDSCSTLNIDIATLQSVSKERGLEYIAEKLLTHADKITKGKTIRENSDEYISLSESCRAHAALDEILEQGLMKDPLGDTAISTAEISPNIPEVEPPKNYDPIVRDPLDVAAEQREANISAYKSQHKKDILMKGLTENEPTSESLITKDVGVELGLSGAALDLITQEKVRTEAIGERAAEVLGFSEEEIRSFGSLKQEEQLAMLDRTLQDETTDLSSEKTYLAYRTLKEIADNPVDSKLDSPRYIEDKPTKPSIFEAETPELKKTEDKENLFKDPTPLPQKKKADLFGDEEMDITLKPKPNNLFDEPDIPKEQKNTSLKRTKISGNEGPLEYIPDPIEQPDSKKDITNQLERKETDHNPLENAKPSIFEAETPELKKTEDKENLFKDPTPLPQKKKADLFGDEEMDITLKSKPSNLFDEPDIPKEQKNTPLKRTKISSNEVPLEYIPDPIEQPDSKKDITNQLERKETDHNPLENAKPSIFEAEEINIGSRIDINSKRTKELFEDPEITTNDEEQTKGKLEEARKQAMEKEKVQKGTLKPPSE